MADGNKRRRTKNSWNSSVTAVTCVAKVFRPIRRAHHAEKSGDWESYLEEVLKECRLCVWASMKVRECYNEVESEDEGRVSIA